MVEHIAQRNVRGADKEMRRDLIIHCKNRLVETTKKLVDMCLTKLLVKITNPSLVNDMCLTNHIG